MVRRWILAPAVAIVLGACAGPPPAPVVDRSAGDRPYQATPDGHYRVRRGDSLYAIAFRYGLDWRDIAHWNGIVAPYVIHPDQLLRLRPASGSPARSGAGESGHAGSVSVTTRPASGASGASTRPLETPKSSTVTTGPEPAASLPPRPAGPPAVEAGTGSTLPPPARASNAPPPSVPGGDPASWLWPAEGRVLSRFQPGDPSRKGIDIAGEVGLPVTASAAGLVVYSGSGLIGYGELIIIKHSDRMLSAYAHNSRRLVSEGQQVAAGSLIAEMGTNDRNQAVLHFEIRVNGTPEDPLKYLPKR